MSIFVTIQGVLTYIYIVDPHHDNLERSKKFLKMWKWGWIPDRELPTVQILLHTVRYLL